jgi:DNA-binding MarR family transcriptional regulator
MNQHNESPDEADGYTSLWARPGYLVRRLHQIHLGLFAEECVGFDITPIQFGLLTVLNQGETLDQVTLSTQVGIDRTSGADVIKRLERRGLVKRFASQRDRRAMLVEITSSGRSLVIEMQPKMQAAQDRLLAPLSDADKQQFILLTQQVIQANNSASRAPIGAMFGASANKPNGQP